MLCSKNTSYRASSSPISRSSIRPLRRAFTGAVLASLGILAVPGCATDTDIDDSIIGTSAAEDLILDPAARRAEIHEALRALPDARVISARASGLPKFVRGDLGRVEVSVDVDKTDLTAALSRIAPVFRARPDSLVLRKTSRDEKGGTHFRLSQVKNGLPVIGAELVVHVRDGVIEGVNGSVAEDREAATEPVIDADAATVTAIETTPSLAELTSLSPDQEPKLAYYLDGEQLRLVYEINVSGFAEDGMPIVDTVLVDAADGSMRLRSPHIHTAKSRNIYSANYGTSLPGTLKRSESSGASGDSIVDTHFDRMGSTYDCYSTLFGRDSWGGGGIAITSSVHYGSSSSDINNAFFNSGASRFAFGDGDGTNYGNFGSYIDVVAHEFTHGVTSKESKLVYSGESGGLNESMSDIFGAVCEWWYDGEVLSGDTWKMGEDVKLNGDAFRYMNDPAADGISIDFYDEYTSSLDVHYSSGLSNLAFYLLAVGGTHPRGESSTSVTGIGILSAAKIFYSANGDYMTSSSTFADARTATVAAAEALYGSTTAISVSQAWDAVGVFREDFTSSVTPASGSWGSWREDAFCPDGTWANGFALRVEGNQGGGDDTALNSVRLYCSNNAATKTTSITSYAGLWGSWGGTSSCSSSTYLNSAKLKIEGNQGGGDDTGANSVMFKCTNGSELSPSNGGGWGSWGSYSSCPSGTGVCGLSIRFEGNQSGGDDTAMNGLELHCCTL